MTARTPTSLPGTGTCSSWPTDGARSSTCASTTSGGPTSAGCASPPAGRTAPRLRTTSSRSPSRPTDPRPTSTRRSKSVALGAHAAHRGHPTSALHVPGRLRDAPMPIGPGHTLSADTPLVVNPPTGPTSPRTAAPKRPSVPTRTATRRRLWQPLYWGTPAQVAETDRRTSVEQAYGQMKASEGVDMSRGFVRVTGLARVTIAIGCSPSRPTSASSRRGRATTTTIAHPITRSSSRATTS